MSSEFFRIHPLRLDPPRFRVFTDCEHGSHYVEIVDGEYVCDADRAPDDPAKCRASVFGCECWHIKRTRKAVESLAVDERFGYLFAAVAGEVTAAAAF